MTADFQGKVDVGVGLATGTPNPATAPDPVEVSAETGGIVVQTASARIAGHTRR